MGRTGHIVANGGWIPRQRPARPKAEFCTFLAVLWFGVALLGVGIWWAGWTQVETSPELVWICPLLIAREPVFVVLAVLFWWKEEPRATTEWQPNPSRDPRKLY